jgi:hypothetical protein
VKQARGEARQSGAESASPDTFVSSPSMTIKEMTLRECPFCDGSTHFRTEGDVTGCYHIGMPHCPVGRWTMTVEQWNHRVSSPEAVSVWQPIETAPKDGSDILVFVPSTSEQFAAYWREGDWTYALYRGTRIICQPSIWQPLPEPPDAALLKVALPL